MIIIEGGFGLLVIVVLWCLHTDRKASELSDSDKARNAWLDSPQGKAWAKWHEQKHRI